MNTSHARDGIADAFDHPRPASRADRKGGGGPTGPHAHARAILVDTQREIKQDAEWLWDRIRAAIRKLPPDQQPQAWQLTHQALTELAADLNQQFTEGGDH